MHGTSRPDGCRNGRSEDVNVLFCWFYYCATGTAMTLLHTGQLNDMCCPVCRVLYSFVGNDDDDDDATDDGHPAHLTVFVFYFNESIVLSPQCIRASFSSSFIVCWSYCFDLQKYKRKPKKKTEGSASRHGCMWWSRWGIYTQYVCCCKRRCTYRRINGKENGQCAASGSLFLGWDIQIPLNRHTHRQIDWCSHKTDRQRGTELRRTNTHGTWDMAHEAWLGQCIK